MLIPPFRGNAGAITPSTNKAGVTTKAVGRFYATAPNDLVSNLGRPQLLATAVQLVSIHPEIFVAFRMSSADDHLTAAVVKDLDRFAFLAIARGFGVDLALEAADLSGLLHGQPELKLQPPWIACPADDERA